MSDFIAIDTEGIDEVRRILQRLPREAQDQVSADVSGYLVNVLKAYPPQKRVKRADAYPDAPYRPGWFTAKQWRWWWANKDDLTLPYRRSQAYRDGWKVVGSGPSRLIANETPAGEFLQDDQRQSRLSALIGWKKLKDVVAERLPRIIQVADAAAKKAVRRLDKSAK